MNTYAIMNLVVEAPLTKITGNDTPIVATGLVLGLDNPNVYPLEVREDYKGEKNVMINGTSFGKSKDLQQACEQAMKFMSIIY
jgi:hypothetical protein